MRIICKASEDVLTLLGECKIRPAVYRLLTYTLSETVGEGTLLHNAVTGEMILLDDAETQNLSALPCEYAPWMDELIKKYYLVKEDLNDKKTVDALRTAWRIADNPKEITGYTILPTTNCNARCFYCYEASCKHENMTDETADKLVDFIDAHRGGKKIHIGWFGGEPLVGIRQIDRISKALTERKISFVSSMISNGYLFNDEIAKRAKEEWNLARIQITLDGTEKVYNETKAYVNPCESPYKKVLENIGHLLNNDISVSVRLNLGLHNADDLNALVEELAERFVNKKNLLVYSHLLFQDCGFEPMNFSEEEMNELTEKKEGLDAKIRAFAIPSSGGDLPCLKKYCCMSDNPQAVMVMPSGDLGKCEHILNGNLVGCLEDGINDPEKVKFFREQMVHPACASCPLYPSCIRLKCCETTSRDCSPMSAGIDLKNKRRIIKLIYEEFLRNNNKAEPETDCRKGGTK